MALVSYDLFGEKHDKVQTSIGRIKTFEPQEGYYFACSFGKDSMTLRALLKMSGVKFDSHYNVTTVDPPELVRFGISQFDTVIYDMPDGTHKYFTTHHDGKMLRSICDDEVAGDVIHFSIPAVPMRKLIVQKQFPPTRLQRYCCESLKETNGVGRIVTTGVRWAESRNRKDNQGLVTIFFDQNAMKVAEEQGANFTKTVRGGVVLNLDNDAERRTVEICYRTNKTLVNPIIDWTDEDIWEFLHSYNIPYCKLYDEGHKRLGCVGCPLGGFSSMKREFERWPQYKKLYISAFDEMFAAREAAGKTNHNRLWTNGEGIFRWWVGEDQKDGKNQISIDLTDGSKEL